MRRKKISIAIPASIISDTPHLREKTSKIGLIGRAAAIFGVEEIIIYRDELEINQKADMDLIATLLNYMETPQYLRKRLFKLRPELQYVGILPPLRTPHHPINKKVVDLKIGEYREGVTVAKTKEGTLIDIGVENPVLIGGMQLPMEKRVTIKIVDVGEEVFASLVNHDEIPLYWGYKVTVWENSFGKLVKTGKFDLKIATSRYGSRFPEIIGSIAEKWRSAKNVLVGFGSPTKGLYEIAKHEGLNLDQIVDFVVNTIPEQSTETVRTEEALIASLAVFNCFLGFKV
ncbi:MAG: putative RNA uridine N3 methyltransferase [Candidatus Bathyarchaeia archaeon]